MPGSPKGPKGKKLTKAEKDKLKKEEDDKKAKEEEDLRLKAEKESQERQEREKSEAEEKKRLENEDIDNPADSSPNEKERVSTAKSIKNISAETDGAPNSRKSSVAGSSAKSRSGSVSSKPGSAISKTGSMNSKSGSAKSKSGLAKSMSGSAKSIRSMSGSAKSMSGSVRSKPESARSKSRSSENRSPSSKTTNEIKNEGDPKEELNIDVKNVVSNEKAAAIGDEDGSNEKGGNKTQAEGILEVEETMPKSEDITQKSPLVPKEETKGVERKIVPVQKEERQSAILRREIAAKAVEAQRREEYEKELQELLERMGGRWVERLYIGKERKRRKGQLLELDQIWEHNRNTLQMEHAEQRKLAKWERYMKCDGSPDPTIQGEINTYMNLWKEDMHSNDIANVLKESRLTLSLIDELNFLIEDTPPEELLPEEVTRYKDTIDELQSMLHQKLELASHDLLMKATELADSESSNLQQVIDNDMICLCMWGNLSKNPRIKQYEFEKKGFTFEIPKVLCLSDCAVRALFTKFDHLSPQSRTYLPRHKRKIEEEKPAEQEAGGEKEEAKEGEDGGEGAKEVEGEGAEASKEEAELEREDSEDVMAALKELEGGEKTVEDKIDEELEEDYDIKTPEPVEWEDFEGDDDAVDLRANHILGGIFHFNLLNMPPQPKQVRNWVIVQVEEPPRLNYMEYLADGAPAPPSSAKPKEEKEKESQEEDGKKREDRPSIGVTIRLPEDVYFCEEPQVVRWNDDSKEWRLDGFSDHVFNEENRILTFKTNYFGTMALIQDAHINMPFQSWEIRPHNTNSAIFTIIAAIVEVEIEIKDGLCSLNIPEDRRELEHLRDVWLPPKQFIKRMRTCGMNIFPAVDSSKYVSVQNKNPVTEDRLYQQMALAASSMAFSWSKWNSDVKDDSRVVIQGTEHLEDEPLLENINTLVNFQAEDNVVFLNSWDEDWSLFLITKKRVTKLKMTEFDEKFSEDHAEGTEFHADLYHMATEIMTPQGRERITNTTDAFTDCVYQLLSATRVITYS